MSDESGQVEGTALEASGWWSPRFRPLRFLVAGLMNTAFGYMVFAGFYALGLHYSVATALSIVFGTMFNYLSLGRVVFQDRQGGGWLRFVVVYGVIYCAQVLGLRIFNELKVSLYFGSAVMIVPNALLAYVLNKVFVFREERGDGV